MSARTKMCTNKVSFRCKEKAEAVAKQFGQRVYECPVCFCWHCTNKENWREEYVDADYMKQQMIYLERRMRNEMNSKLHEKNVQISALHREIKNLRIGHTE